jgi:hypothetical protein
MTRVGPVSSVHVSRILASYPPSSVAFNLTLLGRSYTSKPVKASLAPQYSRPLSPRTIKRRNLLQDIYFSNSCRNGHVTEASSRLDLFQGPSAWSGCITRPLGWELEAASWALWRFVTAERFVERVQELRNLLLIVPSGRRRR